MLPSARLRVVKWFSCLGSRANYPRFHTELTSAKYPLTHTHPLLSWRLYMNKLLLAGTALALTLAASTQGIAADKHADKSTVGSGKIKHVLLLSIDGMHAIDFYNCANGIAGVNGGYPYCPNLAALAQTGINYVATISSKPSDSFPGIAALVTGGTPKSTGLYYDVAYDRSLDGPATTTVTGLAPGTCTPYAPPT